MTNRAGRNLPIFLPRAWLALEEGRPDDAIAAVRKIGHEWGDCTVCPWILLARAYELAGEPDSAIAYYERYVTTPSMARLLVDALEHLALIYERLAELYAQRGDREKAIHYYDRMINLWNDADPELQPRIEAARRAIEELMPPG